MIRRLLFLLGFRRKNRRTQVFTGSLIAVTGTPTIRLMAATGAITRVK
jgi:hypothetical protein